MQGKQYLEFPVMAIDIGGGTQDILLWEPGNNLENCVKMILPSPTRIVAKKIHSSTRDKLPIALVGTTMGGGSCVKAIQEHLEKGFAVFAREEAALTIHDNLARVQDMGIQIVSDPPESAKKICMGDVDTGTLREALGLFEVALPDHFAVAVQDHGFSPNESNRAFRFKYWNRFLERGGKLKELCMLNPPDYMTRMWATKEALENSIVIDTGAAAILGSLCDGEVAARKEEGVIIVNLGNFHTVAALVRGDQVEGIYEHHTRLLTAEKVKDHLERFLKHELSNEEVFSEWGHGCVYGKGTRNSGTFRYVAVTGPRRGLVKDLGYHFVAPFGDMMLTGAFGLLDAAHKCWG